MISSCGSNIGRRAWWVGLAVLVLGMLGADGLQAQNTAKLEGRVRDQAGAPVASAQVRVQGSAFFAEANSQGYYFINNIPAGTYTVEARFVGYKAAAVTGLKLTGGQTITQDFTIEQTAIEITEIEVIAATNELVPRDEVTTKQRVDGDFTSALPVDRLSNVLALQPGVVASAGGSTLLIRGGRADEAVTYIDGVPVSPGYRGTQSRSRTGGTVSNVGQVQVGTNAFEDASVTTGAISSEFGNAQSGLITVTTRSGGSSFQGSVAYETDEVLGSKHGPGFNRVEALISGPLYKNLTFSLSGVLEGRQAFDRGWKADQTPLYVTAGAERIVAVPSAYGDGQADTSYVVVPNFAIASGDCDEFSGSTNSGIKNNYGIECKGVRAPYSPRGTYLVTGKLNYTFGSGNRISLTGIRNITHQRNSTNFTQVLTPQQMTAQEVKNQTVVLSWTQNLSRSADRALALEVYGSYQEDQFVQGALQPGNERDTRDMFGGFLALKGMDFLYDFDNWDVDEALVRRWTTDGPNQVPLDPAANYSTNVDDRVDPWALAAFGNSRSSSPISQLTLSKERRYIGRANLDWQLDRYNRLKLGGELTKYKINHFDRGMANQDICFCDVYVEDPIRYNLFLENRLDLGDVIVVGGLRYDFYDSRSTHQVLVDSGYVFPQHYAGGVDTAVAVADDSHSYISPHIQVSFPVTDRTNFRLSYAHQVQAPDFGLIFAGKNTDLSKTNTNQLFGTDLDFAKTITFEFGVRHQFSEDMVLDVAAYNKDKLADATARIFKLFDPVANVPTQELRYYVNSDFGTVRGIDVRLDRRFGALFNGSVSYTFQDAKNTGTDPSTYVSFFAFLPNPDPTAVPPPPQAILPTSDSRPHNFAGSGSLNFPASWKQGTTVGKILQNVGIFATFRLASGTAYTKCPADATNPDVNAGALSGGLCDKNILGGNEVNRARLPMFKQFDLRLSKAFGIGGNQLSVYADFRNLFNFRNVLQVYSLSGDTKSRRAFEITFDNDSTGMANEAQANAVYDAATAAIDLSGTCSAWINTGARPSEPNCIALQRAEQRFGNGDGTYTLAEQRSASRALFNINNGIHNFIGLPRRVRFGVEFNF